jgi:hypothetical protein
MSSSNNLFSRLCNVEFLLFICLYSSVIIRRNVEIRGNSVYIAYIFNPGTFVSIENGAMFTLMNSYYVALNGNFMLGTGST